MRFLVFTVSSIILIVYASVLYVVIFPHSDYYFQSFIGILHFTLDNAILFVVAYSYYKIVTTPPGKIPHNWAPDGFSEDELEEARKSSAKQKYRKRFYQHHVVRYCKKCNSFKPPRSHHCSECDTCVPKMDHHCPWVNNCVGNNNHKLFILFLYWGVFGISYGLVCLLLQLVYLIFDIMNDRPPTLNPIQGIIIGLNFCILAPIILGMISLFFWQMNLVFVNTTTIEYHEKKWAKKEARKRNVPYKWPYDLGVKLNLHIFFGKNVWGWFLPIPSEYQSDGITYPTAYEMKKLSLYDEENLLDSENDSEVIFEV